MAAIALHHLSSPARAGDPPHPCLLMLHGRGADERDLMGLAPLLPARLHLIAARAPVPMPGGGWMWHDSLGSGVPEPVSLLQSLMRLRRLVAELPAAYPVDPAAVFVLGFSQGAAMALTLTAAEPERLAGTVALSGFLPPGTRTEGLQGRPVLVAHGTADPVLPVPFGRGVREALSAAGAELTYHEYAMAHEIGAEEMADVVAWIEERLPAASA